MNRFNRKLNNLRVRKIKIFNFLISKFNKVNYIFFSQFQPNKYSVDQFDYAECIFIHIPKAAGISVNQSLFGNLGGGHKDLRWYYDRYPLNTVEKYFKFTFVRNPWDRLFSAYNFLRKGGINELDKDFYNKVLHNYPDFNDFVANWVSESNIYTYTHFIPQFEYLIDKNDKINVNFIGKFENIEEDFIQIMKIAKLSGDKKLMTLNKTSENKLNYKDYYSLESIEKVRNIYKRDIELFKYEF